MRSELLGVVGAVLFSSATACHGIFGSDNAVILPVPEVAAPASIPAGTPLSVELTVQSGGCLNFDRVEKKRSGSTATITAWGRDGAGRNVACPDIIRYNRVTVQFDPPFSSTFVIMVSQGAMPATIVTVRVE
jgi:hypothetical protein